MNKQVSFSAILLLIFFITQNLSAQKLWSLEECINYAFENNIQIKQSELSVESANYDYKQKKLNLIPSLNAGANYNFGWGRSIDMATYRLYQQQYPAKLL